MREIERDIYKQNGNKIHVIVIDLQCLYVYFHTCCTYLYKTNLTIN